MLVDVHFFFALYIVYENDIFKGGLACSVTDNIVRIELFAIEPKSRSIGMGMYMATFVIRSVGFQSPNILCTLKSV